MTSRALAWGAAWAMPLVSTIVGIVLVSDPTVSSWSSDGSTQFLESTLDVWPAGLVLLGSGTLGLTAVALAAALRTTTLAGTTLPGTTEPGTTVPTTTVPGVRPAFTDRTPPAGTTAHARTPDSDRIG